MQMATVPTNETRLKLSKFVTVLSCHVITHHHKMRLINSK